MKTIDRPLRRDWPKWHLVSTNIPNAAAVLDTHAIFPSVKKIGKAVFAYRGRDVGGHQDVTDGNKGDRNLGAEEQANGFASAPLPAAVITKRTQTAILTNHDISSHCSYRST